MSDNVDGEYILEVKNLSKRFGGIQALESVNLDVRYGEVHALVGENGAGKSTLMNVLGGIIECDKGEIIYKGQPVAFSSPRRTLANVDFPQPDSPTMATVSEARAEMLISSLALTVRLSPLPNISLAAT